MKEHLLEIEGIQLNAYVHGDENKPLIVCLHGLAGSATYSYTELIGILSKSYRIIAIDQPGHGKSTSFEKEEDYLFSNTAIFYEKVFDQLIDVPFFLIGHSWGADVAIHCAKKFPHKLNGVILLDGGFTFPEYQDDMTFPIAYEGWNDYMDNAQFDNWTDIVNEFEGSTKRWNETLEQGLSTIFVKKEKYELIASKFTVLSIMKAFFEEPFSKVYPFIKVPVLLLHATEPKELEYARKRGISQIKKDIEDVSIVAISGTGHMIQLEEPYVVGDKIHKWIGQTINK